METLLHSLGNGSPVANRNSHIFGGGLARQLAVSSRNTIAAMYAATKACVTNTERPAENLRWDSENSLNAK